MTVDPYSLINFGVDAQDEGPDDDEYVTIAWLAPVLPIGHVANTRQPDGPLPFILVSHVDGTESDEESSADMVVSVHCLYPKGLGQSGRKAANDFARLVHRRMLLLARELPPVVIGTRTADVDYVSVFTSPRFEDYGDDQILRKVGRYRMGLAYAKLS